MLIKNSSIEYVKHALNFAVGPCPHNCSYCYNRKFPHWHKCYAVDLDVEELRVQLINFKAKGGILISSKHDPWGDAMMRLVFADIMVALSEHAEVLTHVRILSKGWASDGVLQALSQSQFILSPGQLWEHGAPVVDRRAIFFGQTITTLDEDVRRCLEPEATTIGYRLQLLKWAHHSGFRTWVSAEPMLKGMDLAKLLKYLPFLEEVWVGPLNHYFMPTYAQSADQIAILVEKANDPRLKPKRELLTPSKKPKEGATR